MHKTNSNTKIVLTVEKIIIRGFRVLSSKPISRKREREMINRNNDYLEFKCFVRDMNTRSFRKLTAKEVVL